MSQKVMLIIPCFNEEQNIESLLTDLRQITIVGFQLVALPINDNSGDATLDKIKNNSENYLDLVNNLGIGGAVQCGLKYALQNDFDWAIQLDGDGQHPPSEIHKLLTKTLAFDLDLCIGSRYLVPKGFQSSYLRRLGIRLLNNLIYFVTKQKLTDCTSGFRLYNKRAINLFVNYYPDQYPEPESIVYALLNGLKVGEVAVEMKERKNGVTSIAGFSTIYYMLKVSLAIIFLKIGFKKSKK
jgi:glycosyltransferase involved in cell wall biosynthesis